MLIGFKRKTFLKLSIFFQALVVMIHSQSPMSGRLFLWCMDGGVLFKGITFSGHFFEMIIHQLSCSFFGRQGQSESNVEAAHSVTRKDTSVPCCCCQPCHQCNLCCQYGDWTQRVPWSRFSVGRGLKSVVMDMKDGDMFVCISHSLAFKCLSEPNWEFVHSQAADTVHSWWKGYRCV